MGIHLRKLLSALVTLTCPLIYSNPVAAQSTEPPWAVQSTNKISEHEITFENRGAKLSGTLYYPTGGRALGTVIALHGTAVPLRSDPLYRHLREALPKLGMAMFLFDRRGSGRSQSGGANPGDFDLLAADGVAAFDALARNPIVDPRRLGFWGLSQRGWLTLLAVAKQPRAAFAIAVSAPMAAADVQMNFAVANILHVRGYSRSVVDAAINARTTVDDFTRGKRTRGEAEAAESGIRKQPWYDLTWIRGNIDDPAWKQQIGADPLSAIDGSRVPTLIIFGQRGPWVPVAASLRSLDASAARHPNLTVNVIDGADHAMMLGVDPKRQVDPAFAAKGAPDAPAYFAVIGAWLERHAMTSDCCR